MSINIMGTPPANYSTDQSSSTRLTPQKGAPLDFRILADGGTASNIVFGNMSSNEQKYFNSIFKGLANDYAEFEKIALEAEANGFPGIAQDARAAMNAIELKMQKLKDVIESVPNHRAGMGVLTGFGPAALEAQEWIKKGGHYKVDQMQTQLAAALGEAQTTDAKPSEVSDMEGGKAGAAKGAESSGMKGSDGSDLSADQANIMQMPPAELHNAFAADPDGVWKTIASLPPQDRNQVMQGLQMAIQQDNQLQSMLSNFMKSLHDTAKAQISNLRV